MPKKNVRIADVVMPVLIAMLLLFAGSSRLKATVESSPANVAVKIDNFRFWTAGDHRTHRNDSYLDKQR
jgi:hypothetical protein